MVQKEGEKQVTEPRILTGEEFMSDHKITLGMLPPGSVIEHISNGKELDNVLDKVVKLLVKANKPDEKVDRPLIFDVARPGRESSKPISRQVIEQERDNGFNGTFSSWRIVVLPPQMPPNITITKKEPSQSHLLTVLVQVDRYSTGGDTGPAGRKAFFVHMPDHHATGAAVLVSMRALKSQRIKRSRLDYYKVLYDPNSY